MIKRLRSLKTGNSAKAEITDDPIDLDYALASVTRSSRRRTIGINVRDAKVFVRAPKDMRRSQIEDFVIDNKDWIRSKLNEQQAAFDNVVMPLWMGSNVLLFNGDELAYERVLGAKKIARVGEVLLIPIELEGEALKKALQKWYKKELRIMLETELSIYAAKMKMDYKSVQIRGFKSRWGSCSKNKELQFNWLLVLVPEAVRHYVIVHELAHINIFDHSPKYWRFVEKFWPNWRIERDWLRHHQGGLQRYL